MDRAKRFVTVVALAFLALGFPPPGFSQDDQDLLIRTYLFKSDIPGAKLSKKDLSAFLAAPPFLSLRRGPGGPGGDDYDAMGKTIGSLYRIPNIIFLTSADMPWEGSRENLNGTVRIGFDIYPLQLYRRGVSSESASLKIEAFRFEFAKSSFTDTASHMMRQAGLRYGYQLFGDTERIVDSVGGVKWLDQEISIPIGSSILTALPTDDRSVFCALRVMRKSDKNMDIGFLGERILSLAIGGTDPVCGRWVIKGNAGGEASELKASLVHKGEFYFFCSEECLTKFQAAPDRYLKKAAFRRNIAAATVGLVAPRPKLAVVPEMPPGSPESRRPGIGRVEFALDENGRINGVRAVRSDGLPFDRDLREVLGQWLFEPGTENGKLTASTYAANISVSAGDSAGEIDVTAPSGPRPGRPDILIKAEEYCRKLENAALYFVCRERIVETIYPGRELNTATYTAKDRIKGDVGFLFTEDAPSGDKLFAYEYQLIRQAGRIRERRRLLEESDKTPVGGKDYPRTRRFFIDRAVLGPVGLFGRESQSLFQYRILDEGMLDGKPVDVVEVKPNSASASRSVYGKAWVDKTTGAILKMEIEAESFSGYDRIAAEYNSQGFRPSVSFEIAYGYENGGLFFPSRIRLKESRYGVGVSGLTVDYDRYKFFSVGTEVKYK